MTTVGAVFLPQLPPERLLPVARAADQAGLAQLWLWEDCFRESGVAAAAAALAVTERLEVGVGLLPVPLRNVALTAMEAATLHRMFPGRVHLAVGHGVQDWMRQVGAAVDSPLTLLREHLLALRALLAGQEVTTQGRYVQLDAVRLDWPPLQPVAVLAGAVGPRTLRLSGEAADGVVLTGGSTTDDVRRARVLVDEGATDRTDRVVITVYLLTASGPDAPERLSRSQEAWGIEASPETGVAGGVDEVADAVRRWAAAGADTVVLQPTDDDPDPEGFVVLAAEVGRRVGQVS